MSSAETRYGKFTERWIAEVKRHPKLGGVREPFATEKLADSFEAHVKAYGTPGGPATQYPDWFVKGRKDPGHTWNAALTALEEAGQGRDRTIELQVGVLRAHKHVGPVLIEQFTYQTAVEFVNDMARRPGRKRG